MEKISDVKSFGGRQQRFKHRSSVLNCEMHFSVYLPPLAAETKVPMLYWLSGLTCTDENFVTKAGFQRCAAELGIAVIAPDTSPRGAQVPDDPDGAYDFGLGAGFYINATEAPWSSHYRMYDYIAQELPELLTAELPLDGSREAIFGHSMGGHGALTIALKQAGRYRSVSAFSPICSPMACQWGQKAFTGYLGSDATAWQAHDAVALIQAGAALPPLKLDQGTADNFYPSQLNTELLQAACEQKNISAEIQLREGYDHSYFFIASYMTEHLRFHAEHLQR